MSAFDGKLLEYSFISVDRFDETNLSSSVYFLSHCHKDHIEGLLDQVFLNHLNEGQQKIKLYTSDTTRNLMLCDNDMKYLLDHVVGLPVHQPTVINAEVKTSHQEYSNESIVVTLISAGHCVGSVMFLFEGRNGTVLYTGDFRLGKQEISKVKCLHSGFRVRHLKSMYVDTTFCSPLVPSLPSRMETKDCLIDIIGSWITKGRHYMVHLKCKGKYGYEYIMKEVAKHFKMKIHANEWRLKMSAKLPDMLQYFTTDASSTQIHCCYYGLKSIESHKYLPCGLKQIQGCSVRMITIIPSSLYFVKNGIPEDYKVWIPSQRLWRVVHSMHASYKEIREVVGYLKPQSIYPFVPPVDCQDIMIAYERLKDLQQEISDSQNSIEENTPQEHHINWTANLQNGNILSPTSAYKHRQSLGVSKHQDLKSPPPLRKRSRRKQEAEETILNKNTREKSVKKLHSNIDSNSDAEALLEEAFGTVTEKNVHAINNEDNVIKINSGHGILKSYTDILNHDYNEENSTEISRDTSEKRSSHEVISVESHDSISHSDSSFSSIDVKLDACSWGTDDSVISESASLHAIDSRGNDIDDNSAGKLHRGTSGGELHENSLIGRIVNIKEDDTGSYPEKATVLKRENKSSLYTENFKEEKIAKLSPESPIKCMMGFKSFVQPSQRSISNEYRSNDNICNLQNECKVDVIDVSSDDEEGGSDSDKTLSLNESSDLSQVY